MTKELTEVNSSNVAAIGFDAGVLTVKYKNNRTYEYHGVPEELYNEILKAESVGQILAEKVKGQFSTQPVAKEDVDVNEEGKTDDTENTEETPEPEEQTAGDSEPDTDTEPAADAGEARGETGADANTEESGVADENSDDTEKPAEGEENQQDGVSTEEGDAVGETEEANADGSGEPANGSGADEGTDTPATSDDTPADDASDADGAGGEGSAGASTEAGENPDDDGDEEATAREGDDSPRLLEDGSVPEQDWLEEAANVILEHFKADKIEHTGVSPENVVIWSVLKLDEDKSDVPIEVKTGTLLELYNTAITAEPTELDQEPNEAQSKNLNAIRDALSRFKIDLQYERVEEKSGDRFWNLKTTVERDDRTLNYTTKIVENCTKDEAEAATEEIVANFVLAG